MVQIAKKDALVGGESNVGDNLEVGDNLKENITPIWQRIAKEVEIGDNGHSKTWDISLKLPIRPKIAIKGRWCVIGYYSLLNWIY